jgi:hypothetical protein
MDIRQWTDAYHLNERVDGLLKVRSNIEDDLRFSTDLGEVSVAATWTRSNKVGMNDPALAPSDL